MKRDPAYLPEGVSVKAGGLWPEWGVRYLGLIGWLLRNRSGVASSTYASASQSLLTLNFNKNRKTNTQH